jgi:EAL domain-containing protein (putative c-di-GMP-specific phosphodiesterase class I)
MTVVAEGVETREQLEALRALGCEYAQGYYFSKPAKPEEIEQKLSRSAAGWQCPVEENCEAPV